MLNICERNVDNSCALGELAIALWFYSKNMPLWTSVMKTCAVPDAGDNSELFTKNDMLKAD